MRAPRILALAALGLAILAALLGGAVTVSLALLQRDAGLQARLAGWLSRMASGPGLTVRVGRVGGDLLSHLALDDVALADASGTWATLDRLRLDWIASDLLRGRLTLDRVALGTLSLARLPAAAPAGGGDGPTPGPPLAIGLERLTIDRLDLGAPVLGVAAALAVTAEGQARPRWRDAGLDLDARRIDGHDGRLTVRLHPPAGRDGLALGLALDEPEGGLAARLLGLPGAPAVRVRLDGSGTAGDWQGRLAAAATGLARLDGAVTLGLGTPDRLRFDGGAEIDGLLPPALRDPLGGLTTLRLAVTRAADGALAIATARIAAQAGSLELSGSLSPALALDATVTVLRLAALSDLAATPLDGSARLTAQVGGSPAAPAVTARLDTDALAVAGLPLAGLGARLDAARAGSRLEIRGVQVAMPGLALTGSGSLDLARGGADARLTARADDLAAWRAQAGLPLAGRLSADATVALAPDGGLAATVTAEAADLALGQPQAETLLGPAPALALRATRGADGVLRLEALSLRGSRLTVDGDGALEGDAARGSLRLAVPRAGLAALGLPATGDAAARIVATRTAERAAATVTADAALAGLPARLAGRLGLDADGITAEALQIETAGARVTGQLRVPRDRLVATGRLALAAPDLGRLSALAGQPLAGALDGSLALRDERGRQAADLTLDGRGLGLGELRLARLSARAGGGDLLGMPRGKASVTATDLRVGAARLARLTATAEGDAARLGWTLATQGRAGQPVTLDAAGTLALEAARTTVALQRLAGRWGTLPVRLRAPATVTLAGADLALSPLQIELGEGRLRLAGSRRGDALGGELELTALPLDLARLAVPDLALAGRFDAQGRLAGTRAAPDASLRVTARRVALAGGAPLDADLTATWRGPRLALDGQLRGLDAQPLSVTAALPVAWPADAPAPTLAWDGPLQARVAGTLDLTRALALARLDQPVAGRATIDIAATGTPARPQLAGSAGLADGRYADPALGLTLRDVTARLAGRGTRLELVSLSATDGRDGRIAGEGAVELGGGAPVGRATLRAERLRLRRDDLDATASAAIDLGADTTGLRVGGGITIDRAEIAVPDRLPVQLVTIDVVEINGGRTARIAAAPASAPPPLPIALDVTVRSPGGILVRGRGLDSEWRGSLAIKGTAAAPDIQGALTLVRGRYDLLGKTLTLSAGTIRFPGGKDLDPVLDITATGTASEMTATIAITGRASKPSLALSSDPALPQDEILARLLFGSSVTQLGAAQALQLAQGVAALTGGGGGGLVDRIRRATGLDVIDVKSGDSGNGTGSGNGGLAGTTLSVGKRLGNRVLVTGEQGATPGSTRAGVEIGLTDQLSVKSDVGAAADSTLGINWKLDY